MMIPEIARRDGIKAHPVNLRSLHVRASVEYDTIN